MCWLFGRYRSGFFSKIFLLVSCSNNVKVRKSRSDVNKGFFRDWNLRFSLVLPWTFYIKVSIENIAIKERDSSENPSNLIFIRVQQVRKFRKVLSLLIQLDSGEHLSPYTRFVSFRQNFYGKPYPTRRGLNWKPTQFELCIKILSVRDFYYVLLN